MIRKLVFCCFSLFLSSLAIGQNFILTRPDLRADRLKPVTSIDPNPTRVTCGPDTLSYGFIKAFEVDTQFQVLGLFGVQNAAAQFYEVPAGGEVSISGFTFYGWSGALDGSSVSVRCGLYQAGPDSLVMGSPISEVTISVDTSFGSGSLVELVRHATFSSPVLINQNFLLVTENLSDSALAVVSNNWNVNAGAEEGLSSLRIGGTWSNGLDLIFGENGPNLDADLLFEPHVTYELIADFTADRDCFPYDSTIHFQSLINPIVQSRFYNRISFESNVDMIPDSSIFWSMGDGTFQIGTMPSNTYSSDSSSYLVELLATVVGYSSICQDLKSMDFSSSEMPEASFSSSLDTSAFTAVFTNLSMAADSFSWDFGNGQTSTEMNPTHTYLGGGIYTVILTAYTCDGMLIDTFSQILSTYPTSIEEDLIEQIGLFPNPTEDLITLDLKLRQPYQVSLTLFNQVGQQLLTIEEEQLQNHQVQLDLQTQVPGIYFLAIDIEGQRVIRKISLR